MKILQIASGDFFSTYGGGQVYVKNLIDELLIQQVNVTIFSFVSRPTTITKKQYKHIDLYEIGANGICEITPLISTINPQIIHAHSQKALIAKLGKQLNIPVIITAHHGGILCPAGTLMNQNDEICSIPSSHKNCLPCCLYNVRSGKYWYPIMKRISKDKYITVGKYLQNKPFIPFITPIGQTGLQIVRKKEDWKDILENCSRMIAPSNAIAQAMIRNGLPNEKLTVIPHRIPLPKHQSTPSNREGVIKFFFVGRISYVKGLHILLQAFHKTSATSAELHLIGGARNANEERYMRKLQKKYNNTHIKWHGKVPADKIFNIIQNYHILVHPTICLEVFGLNISEALAMGKPVIATRCGGAEMQIEEGVNGWLVDPNNVEDLRNKLEQIILNPILPPMRPNQVISISEHCKTLIQLYEDSQSNK